MILFVPCVNVCVMWLILVSTSIYIDMSGLSECLCGMSGLEELYVELWDVEREGMEMLCVGLEGSRVVRLSGYDVCMY